MGQRLLERLGVAQLGKSLIDLLGVEQRVVVFKVIRCGRIKRHIARLRIDVDDVDPDVHEDVPRHLAQPYQRGAVLGRHLVDFKTGGLGVGVGQEDLLLRLLGLDVVDILVESGVEVGLVQPVQEQLLLRRDLVHRLTQIQDTAHPLEEPLHQFDRRLHLAGERLVVDHFDQTAGVGGVDLGSATGLADLLKLAQHLGRHGVGEALGVVSLAQLNVRELLLGGDPQQVVERVGLVGNNVGEKLLRLLNRKGPKCEGVDVLLAHPRHQLPRSIHRHVHVHVFISHLVALTQRGELGRHLLVVHPDTGDALVELAVGGGDNAIRVLAIDLHRSGERLEELVAGQLSFLDRLHTSTGGDDLDHAVEQLAGVRLR